MKMIVVQASPKFASDVTVDAPFKLPKGVAFPSSTSRYPVGAELDQPTVSVVEYRDAKDLNQSRRDPTKVHIPPIPTKLITPRAVSPSMSAELVQSAWGLKAVNAYDYPDAGKSVKVAVLDTGIDRNHKAFNGVNFTVKDFTGEDDPKEPKLIGRDKIGHGTHCAGTIFGRDVNGKRIGIARGVTEVFIGKVIGEKGGGTTDQIVDAINSAREFGAHIISMSIGIDFPGYSKSLVENYGIPPDVATSIALAAYRDNIRLFDLLSRQLVGSAGVKTALLIGAAGNASRMDVSSQYRVTVEPPAAGEGFLSVAAIGPSADGANYKLAPFSNVGATVCAPGVGILSAKADPDGERITEDLVADDGTSMATPHVAGIAALWAETIFPNGLKQFQASRLAMQIQTHAHSIPQLDFEDCGSGLVQAPPMPSPASTRRPSA